MEVQSYIGLVKITMKSPMYKAVGSKISSTAAVLTEWLGSNKTTAAAVSLLAHVYAANMQGRSE